MTLIVGRQAVQGAKRLALELLPPEQRPLLEKHAVGQGKTLEKAISIEGHGLLQMLDACRIESFSFWLEDALPPEVA